MDTNNKRAATTEQQRIAAARAYAQWHIGDPNWADLILRACNNPVSAMENLREEQDA